MNEDEAKMKWLVENRINIQKTALDLYLLIPKEKDSVKKQTSLIHQDLVGAFFCLWRGVFLAYEKKTKLGEPLEHATKFLKKIIDDNTIAFSDDKNLREWTANFYIDCAGRILAGFPTSKGSKATKRAETISPMWKIEKYPSDIKKRWEYNHRILNRKIQSLKKQVAKHVRKL
jgi:hypothetical protein